MIIESKNYSISYKSVNYFAPFMEICVLGLASLFCTVWNIILIWFNIFIFNTDGLYSHNIFFLFISLYMIYTTTFALAEFYDIIIIRREKYNIINKTKKLLYDSNNEYDFDSIHYCGDKYFFIGNTKLTIVPVKSAKNYDSKNLLNYQTV